LRDILSTAGHTPPPLNYSIPRVIRDEEREFAEMYRGQGHVSDHYIAPGGLSMARRDTIMNSSIKLPSNFISDGTLCGPCNMEFAPQQNIIILQCNHKIHRKCFWNLSRNFNFCPLCRQEMGPRTENNE